MALLVALADVGFRRPYAARGPCLPPDTDRPPAFPSIVSALAATIPVAIERARQFAKGWGGRFGRCTPSRTYQLGIRLCPWPEGGKLLNTLLTESAAVSLARHQFIEYGRGQTAVQMHQNNRVGSGRPAMFQARRNTAALPLAHGK